MTGAASDYAAVPGVVRTKAERGETTLVVDVARLREACLHLRDELAFTFLSDISAADYLGWGTAGVAGYIGTPDGRDINHPMTQGFERLPEPKPKRFSLSYHLLAMGAGDPRVRRGPVRRVRVQAWVDEGEAVPSVVEIWPTADWHEREAWDMLGIPFEGHPNLQRILMPDDWEGHPLRKDYPLGGEPVRFSGEE
jgi:NADH-quinone oxidoreductase subunit C